ncbi:copper chaperone PCu(A)C [Galactobacter valiniphilus]|uniref:Copper chaperone PCu(A)C n=1 Tax=Galactobacter valiniphilus TaxID=2676122 RepID=A0A399JFX0_9MICC|nr:copper chaperone PCu(A)C [Galactobacter valiniphilus]RII43517.1 copper chaperone PCu(A)C [Galactobacter valiniphilus]
MRKNLTTTLIALSAAAALGLTGCGASTSNATGTAAATSTQAAHDSVMIADAWVKASTQKDGMSALFGVVTNHTGAERTIVKASSDAAGMVQLHTTVTTAGGGTEMKEKEGGFPLAAGASVTLEPGADHVMLMGLKRDLEAGDTVDVTLTLDDGTEVKVSAPVKAFSGAQESYAPTGDSSTGESSHAGH